MVPSLSRSWTIVSSLGLLVSPFGLINSTYAQTARIYNGIDPNGSETVPLQSWPNSTKAREQFLGNLSNDVGNQTFERVPVGTTSVPDPVRLVFSQPGKKILAGELAGGNGTNFSVKQGDTYKGNYGTSPTKFWSIVTGSGGNFKIVFDKPIAAFGFDGIDIGDFDGILDVTTSLKGKEVKNYKIPLAPGKEAYGSVLFYGIVEGEDKVFDTIEFDTFNTGEIADIFSFDNIVAAFLQQITDTYGKMYDASLQPYAANPQLIVNSTLQLQGSLLDTAGKCDRYGWALDNVDVSSPQFQYLHGKVNNDWRFCFFGEGGQEWAKLDGTSSFGGYSLDSTFFRAGAEAKIGYDFIAGAAYGYAAPQLDSFNFMDTSASITNSVSMGSIYLSYQPGNNWNFTVLGSVGTTHSEGTRFFDYTSTLSVNADSRWASSVRGVGIDIGYEHFFSKKKTRLSPSLKSSVNYQWVQSSSPSFEETGSGQLADIESYDVTANVISLSLAYEHPIKLDSDGLALFIPKIFFDYEYDVNGSSNTMYTVTAIDQETRQGYSTSALLLGGSRVRASLFGDLNLGDSFSVYAGASYLLYGSGSGYSIEGGIRVRM